MGVKHDIEPLAVSRVPTPKHLWIREKDHEKSFFIFMSGKD